MGMASLQFLTLNLWFPVSHHYFAKVKYPEVPKLYYSWVLNYSTQSISEQIYRDLHSMWTVEGVKCSVRLKRDEESSETTN